MIQERLHLPQFSDTKLAGLCRELQRVWLDMAQQINNGLVPFIAQDSEPTIATNTLALWQDTDDSKYYIIANFGGTQKKVELT